MKTKLILIITIIFLLSSNSYANNQWITKKENNQWITKKSKNQNNSESCFKQKGESLLNQYKQYLIKNY